MLLEKAAFGREGESVSVIVEAGQLQEVRWSRLPLGIFFGEGMRFFFWRGSCVEGSFGDREQAVGEKRREFLACWHRVFEGWISIARDS